MNTVALIALYVVAMIIACRFVHVVTDERRLLRAALSKVGLLHPLFRYVDEEDWRCAIGEATRNGERVRFNMSPKQDGTTRLIISSYFGDEKSEMTLML